jgi:hypothetical protein
MKKYKIIKIIIFIFALVCLFYNSATFVSALTAEKESIVVEQKPVVLNNPITIANDSTGAPDINILIGKIINAVLGVVGSIALAMFVYGGLVWMTAAGAAEKVKKGRDILIWATIGLIVIFTAYAMVSFVLTNVIA